MVIQTDFSHRTNFFGLSQLFNLHETIRSKIYSLMRMNASGRYNPSVFFRDEKRGVYILRFGDFTRAEDCRNPICKSSLDDLVAVILELLPTQMGV